MEGVDKSTSELKVFNQKAAAEPVLDEEKGMTSVL